MPRTRYDAPLHGFHFRNGSIRWSFGLSNGTQLCGGMSFGSLDYFYNRLPIPSGWGAPEEGTSLHNFIYARQMDAHRYAIPRLIAGDRRWRNNPFEAGMRPDQNFGVVKRVIDSGRPLPILLSSSSNSLSTNSHWVVALGYEAASDSRLRKLYLYDSNRPNTESELIPDLSSHTFKVRGRRHEYGYYAPYEAYQPIHPERYQSSGSMTNIATNPFNLTSPGL